MGVAHHTAYPVWFEMGRTELLRASHPADTNGTSSPRSYRDLEQQGVLLAVVSLNVRYKLPARYDDLLTLHTRITNIGHAKIEHEYELMRDGVLLATASTTLACLDRTGRPQPLPDSIRVPTPSSLTPDP